MEKKKVYLLSYPRSGNTLARYIIERFMNVKTVNSYQHPKDNKSILEQLEEPEVPFKWNEEWEVIKTHDFHSVDFRCPVLYLTRDDAFVSHARREMKARKFTPTAYPSLVVQEAEIWAHMEFSIQRAMKKGSKAGIAVCDYHEFVDNPMDILASMAFLTGLTFIQPYGGQEWEFHKSVVKDLYNEIHK